MDQVRKIATVSLGNITIVTLVLFFFLIGAMISFYQFGHLGLAITFFMTILVGGGLCLLLGLVVVAGMIVRDQGN